MIKDRDTVFELIGKILELQNEVNCMNDSKDFQDAESIRSGNSHVASQPVSFQPHPVLGIMLSRSIGMPSRREEGRHAFGTRMVHRETFLQVQRRLVQHFIRRSPNFWVSNISEHISPHVMSESQTPV